MGDRVFPIFELPTSALPDLHDGTLEDWEAALIPSLDHSDFAAITYNGVYGLSPMDPAEIAVSVYLAWHHASQRVFVGIYRFDAFHQFRLPPEPPPAQVSFPEDEMCCWMWDHVEIVIDGDHGGELCLAPGRPGAGPAQIERFRRVDNVVCQNYQVVPEAEGDRRIRGYGLGPLWAFEPPYTDGGGFRIGESPSLSGYEVAVTPWDELQDDPTRSTRTRLDPWEIVGLCINLFDLNDFIDWERYLVTGGLPTPWSVYGSSGCDALAGGTGSIDAQLIPCFEGDCSAGKSSPESSAVRADSWGRIKAAFVR